MESPEEFAASNDHTMIVKGKRTKRQRPSSPPVAMTSSSSSGGNSSSGGGGRGDVKYYYSSIPSPTTSTSTDQEDEDMANCLILLAQGTTLDKLEKFGTISHRRYFTHDTATTTTTTTTTTTGKAGFYVYECKTCNRTFPSFQALGGHRASHKKPKVMTVLATTIDHQDEKQQEEEEEEAEEKIISLPISIQTTTKATITSSSHVNHKSNKVHECSICGSEFSSGQALGGHMRRHRAHPPGTINQISMSFDTITNFMESQEGIIKRPRNVLQLDLNLPAPPEIEENDDGEEIRDSKFHFFSAPALVDCHY